MNPPLLDAPRIPTPRAPTYVKVQGAQITGSTGGALSKATAAGNTLIVYVVSNSATVPTITTTGVVQTMTCGYYSGGHTNDWTGIFYILNTPAGITGYSTSGIYASSYREIQGIVANPYIYWNFGGNNTAGTTFSVPVPGGQAAGDFLTDALAYAVGNGNTPKADGWTDAAICSQYGQTSYNGTTLTGGSGSLPASTTYDVCTLSFRQVNNAGPWSAVGSMTTKFVTSGQGSITVPVVNMGALLVLYTKTNINTNYVTNVSGAGVSNWTQALTGFTDTVGSPAHVQQCWIAQAAQTGSLNLSITYQASIGSTGVELCFQEFYTGDPNATYVVDGTNTANNGSANYMTWPSLTPSSQGGCDLWLGFARVVGSSGSNYRTPTNPMQFQIDGNSNPFVYALNVSQGPFGPQLWLPTACTNAPSCLMVRAILSVGGVSDTTGSNSSSGNIGTLGALVGTSNTGVIGVGNAGTITQTMMLSGSSATPSSGTGKISETLVLAGSSATGSAGNGVIVAMLGPSGLSTTASAGSGTLTQKYTVSGLSSTPSLGTGTLTGVSTMQISGLSATASSGSGTLIATGILAGLSSTVSGGSGTLSATGVISGSSATATAGNGTLWLTSIISGTSATPTLGQGTLISGAIIISGLSASTPMAGAGTLLPLFFTPPSRGSQDYVWVEILDANLVRQGMIQFATLTAQLYYNAVGSWSMTVPYSDFLWNLIMSGDFFVNINWRGLFSFGGKCEQPGYTDSIPGSSGSTGSTGPYITLSGATYEALLANRITYPTPSAAWSAQTAAGTDAVSGMHLESAIKHYVNNNVGPAALSSRRVSSLTLATDQGRGATVSYTVKFVQGGDLNLFDIIRKLISQTGNGNAMGVSISRGGSHGLVFDVYVPRNLSGKAWFSRDLGNLTAISFSLTDPTCTDALVQGSGTNFIQKTGNSKTQYNQVEAFSDSSGETDVNNLNTTAQDAILSGAAGPTLSATLAETPYLTFGRDFGLGDIVTIEVRPGNFYSDVITGVTLTADPSQTPMVSVVPTVGQNANATATDQTIIGQLTKRIRTLERRLRILWWSTTHGLTSSTSYRLRATGKPLPP